MGGSRPRALRRLDPRHRAERREALLFYRLARAGRAYGQDGVHPRRHTAARRSGDPFRWHSPGHKVGLGGPGPAAHRLAVPDAVRIAFDPEALREFATKPGHPGPSYRWPDLRRPRVEVDRRERVVRHGIRPGRHRRDDGSQHRGRPGDSGSLLGQGAAVLVLEAEAAAIARSARVLGKLLGSAAPPMGKEAQDACVTGLDHVRYRR